MKVRHLHTAVWPALLLLSAAAQAHSPYLKPNTFSAEAARKHVTVEASFAEGGLRPDVAMEGLPGYGSKSYISDLHLILDCQMRLEN